MRWQSKSMEDTSIRARRLPTNVVSCIRIVLTLVDYGFEPNERIDRLPGPTISEFEEFIGFAPIQILACAAMEADNLKGRVSDGLLACILKVLVDTSDALVRNGARLSLDAPPTQRLFAAKSDSNGAHSESDGPIIDAYDRTSLKVDGNKKIASLLGGNDKLNASKKAWQELKASPTTCNFSLPFEHESAFAEKLTAGGSSEKSCAICWSEFGSIMNRKHRCRVSQRFVCDDCSSKRVLHDGKEVRVSDGQFAAVRADLSAAQSQELQRKRAENEANINKMKQAHEKVRQTRIDEETQRDSLFGSMIENAAKMLAGEEEATKPASAVVNQVNGLTDSLNQTRNALLDRGQKLDSLGEKTSKMVDSSAEFAKMAKELQRQSERGFFW
jgi:transposase-like protein